MFRGVFRSNAAVLQRYIQSIAVRRPLLTRFSSTASEPSSSNSANPEPQSTSSQASSSSPPSRQKKRRRLTLEQRAEYVLQCLERQKQKRDEAALAAGRIPGKMGRPARVKTEEELAAERIPGKRGRPARVKTDEELAAKVPKQPRRRPRKNKEQVEQQQPQQASVDDEVAVVAAADANGTDSAAANATEPIAKAAALKKPRASRSRKNTEQQPQLADDVASTASSSEQLADSTADVIELPSGPIIDEESGLKIISIKYPRRRRSAAAAAQEADEFDADEGDDVFLSHLAAEQNENEQLSAESSGFSSSSSSVIRVRRTSKPFTSADDETSEAAAKAKKPRMPLTLDQQLAREEAAEELLDQQFRARQAARAQRRAELEAALAAEAVDASSESTSATAAVAVDVGGAVAVVHTDKSSAEAAAWSAQLRSVAQRMATQPLPTEVWQRYPASAPGKFSVHEILQVVQEQRGSKVAIYDVRGRNPLCDVSIMVTGSSTTHIRAIADAVAKKARSVLRPQPSQRGVRNPSLNSGSNTICLDVQGRDSDDWMLFDLQSVVLHVMTAEGRQTYRYLEERALIDSQWTHNPIQMTEEARSQLRAEVDAAQARARGSSLKIMNDRSNKKPSSSSSSSSSGDKFSSFGSASSSAAAIEQSDEQQAAAEARRKEAMKKMLDL